NNPFAKLIENYQVRATPSGKKKYANNTSPISAPFHILETTLLARQKKAQHNGCCKEKPHLFYLKHVFCDTIAKQLKKHAFIGSVCHFSSCENQPIKQLTA
ncbi:MAG: hypothetical protein JKY13_02480, partial [Gammaproteobacteria bacterium]|nr:hypothetical protein [Gammaproteobacteria bacterium]